MGRYEYLRELEIDFYRKYRHDHTELHIYDHWVRDRSPEHIRIGYLERLLNDYENRADGVQGESF